MKHITRLINTAIIFALANCTTFIRDREKGWMIALLVLLFLFINVLPSIHNRKLQKMSLRAEGDGCELLILFCLTTVCTAVYLIWQAFKLIPDNILDLVLNIIIAVVTEAIIFWNGIIRVYTTSVQLGIKWRVIGIVCGWIPIAHLIALFHIIRICTREVKAENDRLILNEKRQEQQICASRFPVLMVHGVFFRDFRYFNYWGRIPQELIKNGAKIFYGNHQSAASVADSGQELTNRIKQIVEETGCEKVNIIAHSKGGLDCRYAISHCGADSMVASLTTINTPHKGCLFADHLLTKIPEKIKNTVAEQYNKALRELGDYEPDFLKAVEDLTAAACEKINESTPNAAGIYYQSVGSKLNHGVGGRFPLNFSYQLVKHFDGPNDGLVAENSFAWGEDYQFLTVRGKRGISHGDMIDLNRENIPEFDVREFYIGLVAKLKEKGL